MRNYEIKKILSNNVVLVKEGKHNYILVGKGIGFGKKKGQTLEDNDIIEQSFISLDNLNQHEQKTFINEVDSVVFEISKDIVEFANKKLGETLNPKIHLGLIDHINYAMKRINEGIEIVNPFLNETKVLYPEEYKIAEKAIEMLSKHYKIEIPEAEIGFITLHIYGGRDNRSKTEALKHTKLIKDITKYVERRLGIDFSKSPFNYSRFIIHLKALINRIEMGETVDTNITDSLKNEFTLEFSLAKSIVKMIEHSLKKEVSANEIGYITLHLGRLKHLK
ncbi:PRD domain-containing protein [Mycoplasmatota bacterium]|nr:PRD domain-containing protein [Mycoplasmatota bacterium]